MLLRVIALFDTDAAQAVGKVNYYLFGRNIIL